ATNPPGQAVMPAKGAWARSTKRASSVPGASPREKAITSVVYPYGGYSRARYRCAHSGGASPLSDRIENSSAIRPPSLGAHSEHVLIYRSTGTRRNPVPPTRLAHVVWCLQGQGRPRGRADLSDRFPPLPQGMASARRGTSHGKSCSGRP